MNGKTIKFNNKPIKFNGALVREPKQAEPTDLCIIAEEANAQVKFKKASKIETAWDIEYSTDGITWTEATETTTTITLTNVGDKVYFRGPATNARGQTTTVYNKFDLNAGKVAARGNVMSLMGNATALTEEYQLARLFFECSDLTAGPSMTATTLSNYCYQSTFRRCTSLGVTPELPATILSSHCYHFMFAECTALTTPMAVLPSSQGNAYCYNNMFKGCTALTSGPHIKLTTLNSSSCLIYMFRDCSSLSSIKIDYTGNFGSSNMNGWVTGVASTGTFYYNGTYTTRGVDAIPAG